jgi:glycerophosphoryl diester phosphodiesterase
VVVKIVVNYAHRGASGYYPENTMLAFEKAVELGCDGVETDVQMTNDGVLVLIHDETVNRTTDGVGYVKDFSFNALRKLSAGQRYKNNKNFNEIIPTAEELLILALETNIKINFEIKTGIVEYLGIERKLIDLINKYNMKKNVILSSFNHYAMVRCKEIDKEILTGLLYMEGLYRPEVYCRYVGADAIHPYFYAVNSKIVRDTKSEGLLVNPFTVNEESDMKNLINMGVDGIITNFPDKLKKLLEEKIIYE